jgi:hypothetical protein
MLGAQIIAAFKDNNNTIVAKTFNVKYYNDVISKKLVTIDTWDMRAEHDVDDGFGKWAPR